MKKLLLVLLSSLFLCGCQAEGLVKEYRLEQILFSSNYSMSGIFFLGCGSTSVDKFFYYYFYTNDKGAITFHKIPYNFVTIFYTKDKPKAIFSAHGCIGSSDLKYYGDNVEKVIDHSCGYRWDVYIPEGSIINNYDVNIK